MTDKQVLIYYRAENKRLIKSLKMFSKFKLIVEDALAGQKLGHTNGWVKVQDKLDKIDDKFDCETFLNDY